jgi:hypothetical protein
MVSKGVFENVSYNTFFFPLFFRSIFLIIALFRLLVTSLRLWERIGITLISPRFYRANYSGNSAFPCSSCSLANSLATRYVHFFLVYSEKLILIYYSFSTSRVLVWMPANSRACKKLALVTFSVNTSIIFLSPVSN